MNKEKFISWLKIIRFQFYPMTFLAYTLGALSSLKILNKFDLGVYLLGYLAMFFIEFVTVISNEFYDLETDRINKNYSQFTGGSRMLVEGKILLNEVQKATIFGLVMVFILAITLTYITSIYSFIALLIGLILGLSYTLPPIKLSYRGIGELDVGVTHSFYIVIAGFLLQSQRIDLTFPWLISIPLFFAVFGAIILAGFPDLLADQKVGKRTLTVILGKKRATILSIISISLSIISSIIIVILGILGSLGMLFIVAIAQGIILLYLLSVLFRSDIIEGQINMQLQFSLAYIMWFTLIPIVYLMGIF